MRRVRVLTLCVCGAVVPAIAQQSQSTLTGNLSGSGTTNCSPNGSTSSPDAFSGYLIATVQPALSSLVTAGGSFSGTSLWAGSDTACQKTRANNFTGTISGAVSPGGAVSFTFSVPSQGLTGSGTGTATASTASLTGKFSVPPDSQGNSDSGSFSLTLFSGGTTLIGAFNGGGTIYCQKGPGPTSPSTFSTFVIATVQPALSSLVTAGGSFSGTLNGGGSSIQGSPPCPATLAANLSGTISGTVSPGGSVSWTFTMNTVDGHGNSGTFGGSGGGTTKALTANLSFFDPTEQPTPQYASVFLTSLDFAVSAAPAITTGGIVPVYSAATTIQQGEWVSIYGTNLASGTFTWNGDFPKSLGGTSVTINGNLAYLWYVSPTQINLQAPNDTATGTVPVVVTTVSGSQTSTVTLAQFGPSFSLLDAKHVAGIILRSNGSGAYGGGTYDIIGPTGSSLGYPTVAAKGGDGVVLFGVGFGPTNPAVLAGQVFSGAAATANPVGLLINNASVSPAFSGLSSAGLYQLNVTIPTGLGTGDVSLRASVGGLQTPSGVVISLQ